MILWTQGVHTFLQLLLDVLALNRLQFGIAVENLSVDPNGKWHGTQLESQSVTKLIGELIKSMTWNRPGCLPMVLDQLKYIGDEVGLRCQIEP